MTTEKQQSIVGYYFSAYGGWSALFKSKYFWCAAIFTVAMAPYWLSQAWWNDVLDVIPNLLGFTLGGYAMLLAFGNEKFQKILAEVNDGEEFSAFVDLNVAFVHFIVLQVVSILLALLSKAYYFELPPDSFFYRFADIFVVAAVPWYALCYFVFLYAIFSAFAATFAILRMMKMYQLFLNSK